MPTIFEIDEAIANCVNPETGEFDEERYEELQLERTEKIDRAAALYKETAAFAKALKEQEEIFTERRKREEKKCESLKQYLARALNGEKFKSLNVEIGFRKAKSVNLSEEFVKWAQEHDRDDLLSFKEPTANKTAIKKAIESGETVPAEIVENLNISIK